MTPHNTGVCPSLSFSTVPLYTGFLVPKHRDCISFLLLLKHVAIRFLASNNTDLFYWALRAKKKSKPSFTELKWRCWQGWFLLDDLMEQPCPCLFQLLDAAHIPWLIPQPSEASPQPLFPSSYHPFLLWPSNLALIRMCAITMDPFRQLGPSISRALTVKFYLPCEVTKSQVAGIRTWLSLKEAIVLPTTHPKPQPPFKIVASLSWDVIYLSLLQKWILTG